jgi:hypothetical protein
LAKEESARMRMDHDTNQDSNANWIKKEMPSAGPYNSTQPLETLEQERNRLSRKLAQTLGENEVRIKVLCEMLKDLERWQKNGYYLRDSINQSSQVQMDQIHQMREYLK